MPFTLQAAISAQPGLVPQAHASASRIPYKNAAQVSNKSYMRSKIPSTTKMSYVQSDVLSKSYGSYLESFNQNSNNNFDVGQNAQTTSGTTYQSVPSHNFATVAKPPTTKSANQVYQQMKSQEQILSNSGSQFSQIQNQGSAVTSQTIDNSLPIVNQLGSDTFMVNNAHFSTAANTSQRSRPSILMSAVNNAKMQITMDPPATSQEVARKEKGSTQQRMIKLMKKQNQRDKRAEFQVPTLGPLGDDKFWSFKIFPRMYKSWSQMNRKDQIVAGIIASTHIMALGAPFCYTPKALMLCFWSYMITAIGITASFHRQLTHKSFKSPKWVERILATFGTLAVQGHPIEWCSNHRHHHAHCDTEVDPHSPYDGLWWSHMGWLFDSKSQIILFDTSNVKDLKRDNYYVWLKKNYLWVTIGQPLAYFLLGGFPALCWGYALRTVLTWHVTWAVNSLSHVWGRQEFKTGDISMNNPLIGVLALGEGWHNNHHAFEDSVRHGMKWWQIDMTWWFVLALEKMGLASNLRYISKERQDKIRWSNQEVAMASAV